jgi:hypothetical protein
MLANDLWRPVLDAKNLRKFTPCIGELLRLECPLEAVVSLLLATSGKTTYLQLCLAECYADLLVFHNPIVPPSMLAPCLFWLPIQWNRDRVGMI